MSKRLFAIVLCLPLFAACTTFWMGGGYEKVRQGSSSSLVDFLYPDGEVPPARSDVLPYLQLPVRVGIAFVPTTSNEDISAVEKEQLLEKVAAAFRDRDYVKSIETIPENYLRSARGMQGMRQVASLHDVDVMALVSYDQVSFSGERDSALLYWTVIGALVVKGNSNEVQTMIDTAVFDVATTRLLFRAPGTARQQRNATLVDTARDLRDLRSAGFVTATDDMIVNLDQELDEFRAAMERGERAQYGWSGGSGGGSLSWPFLVLIGLILLGHRARRWRA